jgi:hypothetical protein
LATTITKQQKDAMVKDIPTLNIDMANMMVGLKGFEKEVREWRKESERVEEIQGEGMSWGCCGWERGSDCVTDSGGEKMKD